MNDKTQETWDSGLGAVLAVAGSAVGFGNFLRFPGLAAQYGGGAFMIAYFTAFLLLGVPLCWVEWTIGRRGGILGGHSCVSAFLLISRSKTWKYLGTCGVIATLGISMYYMYLEGWTIGYCYNMAAGNLHLGSTEEFSAFFSNFAGLSGDGAVYDFDKTNLSIFFVLAVLANLYVLYRGLSRGIEWFCKWSMPVLLLTAMIILIRVLTLGTPDSAHPERSINQGLGYMWNPSKTVLLVDSKTVEMIPANVTQQEKERIISKVQATYPTATVTEQHISLLDGLLNPDLWITAAGQLFFSLSIGFGTVLCYASYVRRGKDIALSSLTANAANEVVEVGIAGMMIVPAAVSLLGVAAAAGASTFGLGFTVLPEVFAAMPGGRFIGTLFFGLLALAAVTSSISMLQPSIAFMEEFWGIQRTQCVAIIGMVMVIGAFIVSWFTGKGMMALGTLDFWMGTMCLFVLSGLFLILFRFIWGTENGLRELRRGSLISLPRCLAFIINWITPTIFAIIFFSWIYKNIFGETSEHITNLLKGEPGAVIPMLLMAGICMLIIFIIHTSDRFHHIPHSATPNK